MVISINSPEPENPQMRRYATTSQASVRSVTPIKMERSNKKIWIISTIGIVIAILGIITGSFWSLIYDWIIFKLLVLTPSSLSYNMWEKTPIPMYFKFYMFNWTNPEHFHTGVEPHFEEMGPYVFREIDYKVHLVWNENGTVTFQRKKIWFFEDSLSNGSLSDKVTNLNPIAATVAYSVRNKSALIRILANKLMVHLDEKLLLTKSVNELLFMGYNDTLLRIAQEMKMTKLPYIKFGWFYARNASETYDGTFNMFTGSTDLYDKGVSKQWNFQNKTDYYKEPCNVVDGMLGDLWPPLPDNNTVSLFIPDICTSLKFSSANTTMFQNLIGNKYVGDEETLDNGKMIPSRECYCPNGDCGPSGTLNISSCKFGAPAFVSMPHFYLADPSYTNAITGMSPNKEKHESSMIVEPITGTPMQIKVQLQLNLLIEPVEHMSLFQNISKVYIPMLWFVQEANLTTSYASQVKLLLTLSTLGSVSCFGIAGIGILIFFIGLFTYIRQKWRGEEGQVLLSKYDGDTISKSDT